MHLLLRATVEALLVCAMATALLLLLLVLGAHVIRSLDNPPPANPWYTIPQRTPHQ